MKKTSLSLLAVAVGLGAVSVPALAQRTLTRPGVVSPLATGLGTSGAAAGAGGTTPMGGPGAPNAGGSSGGTGTSGSPTSGAAGAGSGQKTPTVVGPGGKAQGDTGALPQFEQGVEYEPRNPNYKVALSLEDADLAELVRVIGQLTGKRFIFGGKVRNIKASIYAPQKVTVAEAYQAFLSILETNGLTVVPHGRFLKIVETGGIATQATPTYGAEQGGAPNEDRYVTRMLRLQHAPADEVANVLGHFKSKDGDITVASSGNLLILTDTGSNIRRMMQIIEEVDVGSAGDQMWIEPVHYAAASDIANRINELFDLKGGKEGKGAVAGAGVGALHVTKVAADDRSNSVIIVATEPAYLRILEFIKRLDVPQSGEGEIHVLPLQHADAVELTKTLNELVQGAGAAASGGTAAAGRTGANAPAQVFEGGIKISADKSTNSIVVTSSMRDFASLRAVVDRLDRPRRQVFIEAVIMDMSVTRSDQLGINFHGGGLSDLGIGGGQSLLFGGLNPMETVAPIGSDPSVLQGLALGLRGPGIPGTESLSVTGQTIPAFGIILQALTTTGDTDVLSTPHILATDNVKAEINVGQNVPLQTNIGGVPSGGTTGAAGASAMPTGFGFGFGASPPRQDVGTKVTITPHLNESNEVRLELAEEISETGPAEGQLGVIPINKRTATTQLVVKDQQTVVIGGLMRNRLAHSETKIPILGDIPVLGLLFRQTTNEMQKSNLLLILTPYIIRDQSDLRAIFERKMQERQEFLDRYFVFSEDHDYKPVKDYSRTNGLLEEIRATYKTVEEREKFEDLTKPKEILGHRPGEPLDLPSELHTTGTPTTSTGAPPGAAGGAPATTGRQPPNVNIAPPVRNIERIEK